MADEAPTMERVLPLLHTRAIGRSIVCLERCGSTNDEAAQRARAGAPHGSVVVAAAQDAGRGRLGRTWWSPPGENLYASFILRLALGAEVAPPLTLAAAVAVVEAVEEASGIRAGLKWPNDLLAPATKAKLGGLLTELVTRPGEEAGTRAIDFVVIGLGLNVQSRSFPTELAGRASSLALEGGRDLSRAKLLAAICDRIEHWIDRYLREGVAVVAAAWRTHGDPAGCRLRVQIGETLVEGQARGIDDDGALLLDADDGRHLRVLSGELVP